MLIHQVKMSRYIQKNQNSIFYNHCIITISFVIIGAYFLRSYFLETEEMSVSIDDVKKVAHLARIKLDESKTDELCGSLNSILHFVEQLNEVDCSKIDDDMQYTTTLHERADIAVPCDPAVMDNAPQKECNMFVVPKVVG